MMEIFVLHCRMVLEPKFTDYGSITSAELPQSQQHIAAHALLSPRSVLSLPQIDDEPKTSKGKNMSQGNYSKSIIPNVSKLLIVLGQIIIRLLSFNYIFLMYV